MESVEVSAYFPEAFAAFDEAIKHLAECTIRNTQVIGDIAESTQTVKSMLKAVASARKLHEFSQIQSHFSKLRSLNLNLISDQAKLAENQNKLSEVQRQVGSLVSKPFFF